MIQENGLGFPFFLRMIELPKKRRGVVKKILVTLFPGLNHKSFLLHPLQKIDSIVRLLYAIFLSRFDVSRTKDRTQHHNKKNKNK
jgi:hypothetical protein